MLIRIIIKCLRRVSTFYRPKGQRNVQRLCLRFVLTLGADWSNVPINDLYSGNVCVPFFLQAIYLQIIGHPEKSLNGELSLVTGGGGGLGRMLALRLAKLGVHVVIWDINQEGKRKLLILNFTLKKKRFHLLRSITINTK